ncbi:MAG: pentapeptide repeat-containing protein [Cyanobacteria bacterium J06659_2]
MGKPAHLNRTLHQIASAALPQVETIIQSVLPLLVCITAVLPVGVFVWEAPRQPIYSVNSTTDQETFELEGTTWDDVLPILSVVGGAALLLTVYVATKNPQMFGRLWRFGKDRQLADSFSEAIKMLNNVDKRQVRSEGIHRLEQIAKDSPKDYHWKVMQALAAFVRETSPAKSNGCEADVSSVTTDVQTALTAIANRKAEHDPPADVLNLQDTNLKGVNLRDANLSHARIGYVNLCGVNLRGANLSSVDFRFTTLSGATLSGATLSGVRLIGAKLIGANLVGTNLSDADLRFTDLSESDLTGTNLSKTDLTGTNFDEANLSSTNFNGAKLKYANLNGADLTGANFIGAECLQPVQVKIAENWAQATYESDFRKQLGLDTP